MPKLITYPARPKNGGNWESAPMKLGGKWGYEPKYNGWRVLVHVPTATMFNRHGQPLSNAHEFQDAVLRLQLSGCPYEWLDCEGLGRRHPIGQGALIILDIIDRCTTPYPERIMVSTREWKDAPPIHTLVEQPKPNSVLFVPGPFSGEQFPVDHEANEVSWVWHMMQKKNKEWGCQFYEGMVAKRYNSNYPIQLLDSGIETPDWYKHRWEW